MAKHRDRLFELMSDGVLDPATLARDIMGYMSDDDIRDFAHANDIELFPEEDDAPEEEEEFEFDDEDDARGESLKN